MHKIPFCGMDHHKSFQFQIGTIHLRRRHALEGEGSKIGQIFRWIVVKNCRREGGRGQKS